MFPASLWLFFTFKLIVMQQRRSFLKQASALVLGGLVLPRIAGAHTLFAPKPLGIQMFTLFRLADDEPRQIFGQLAEIGFKEIETSFSRKGPFYGLKPKELKTLLGDLGLTWRSHHVLGAPMGGASNMPTLKTGLQQLVDEAAEGGLPYLVCSSAPVKTGEEMRSTIDLFNKSGEACKKAGIQFAYHNHATEFDLVEGSRPYDLIMKGTDKDLVKMELDLAWATKAKQDPVALFKEYPGRFPLWHVKDIDAARDKITEIGNGIVDFKAAFAAAKLAGMKHFFYEQDMVQSMESVKTSYTNLRKVVA